MFLQALYFFLNKIIFYLFEIFFIRGVGILIEEIINKYIQFWPLYFKNQGEAAEALNISRSHFNKIINKRDFPSTSLLIRMENKMKEYNF